MYRYVKEKSLVEAIQFDGDVKKYAKYGVKFDVILAPNSWPRFLVFSLGGWVSVNTGDYLIKEATNYFRPIPKDIFDLTYSRYEPNGELSGLD